MIYRNVLSLILAFSIFTTVLPTISYAQTNISDYSKQISEIETKVEKRRQELGIPGMSLVIVKDGQIIFIKGFGYKDLENKIPVTPDTQFAIGSITKSFTGLSVLMSADEGKLALEDSPKKYLTYFKMKDVETDKNITIRDLMDHSSGLNRTDLAMLTGKLNRRELIQVAGEAQPMAKLNQKFFYNNIMFSAAGEIVATVQKQPWESFVQKRIFAPLGMNNSAMSIAQMIKTKDFSFGYEYNSDTKVTTKFPINLAVRPLDGVAAAGAITSSARDMAKWLNFTINKGEFDGKRLVSEKGFAEWVKPQNKISPNDNLSYSLGWFLKDFNGLQGIGHGGNVPGFTSWMAMIPEKKLGFVMLSNVSNTPFGDELTSIVLNAFLDKKETSQPNNSVSVSPEKEVGKYRFEQAGVDVEVKMQDAKLVAIVPEQPVYELQNIGGRKYKLSNAPAGFFVTFSDDSLLFEQPQGNVKMSKIIDSQKTLPTENKPPITVDVLMSKAIEAAGGEANQRKITSRVTIAEIDAIHQGVKGKSTSYAKFPNKSATETMLTVFGKTIGNSWSFFDGNSGEDAYSYYSGEKYSGKRLEDVRIDSDFYSILKWKNNFQTIEVKGTEKVGDEECFVVELTPEKGTKVTNYYSTKSFLLLKKSGTTVSSQGPSENYSFIYSDYREVDGVKIPFKTLNSTNSMGDIISTVKSVKHNVKIDDKLFSPRNVRVK
jgi:CubicO group peptidase (beta-lactamase class C family)